MGPSRHPPPAAERNLPVVSGADGKVGHRPPAHPRGLLHPHTQRITRHHTHCTGAAAGPTPGGQRGRNPPGVLGTPPQPPPNTCRTGSPSVTSPTTTMPPATRGDAAHCPCSGHHPRAPLRGGKSSPAPWRSRTCGSRTRRRTSRRLAHTSSSPWKERRPSKTCTQRRERTTYRRTQTPWCGYTPTNTPHPPPWYQGPTPGT